MKIYLQSNKILYKEPLPKIPYPHIGTKVSPHGFERVRESYPSKVLKSLNKKESR